MHFLHSIMSFNGAMFNEQIRLFSLFDSLHRRQRGDSNGYAKRCGRTKLGR